MNTRIRFLGLGIAIVMVACKKDAPSTTTTAASVSAAAAPASTPAAKPTELPPLDDKLPPEELAKAMIPRFVSYDLGPKSDDFKGVSLKAPPDADVDQSAGWQPTIKVRGSDKDSDKFVAADVLIVKQNVDFAALKTKLLADAKKSTSIKVDIEFVTDTADVLEWKQISPSITNYGYAKHVPGGVYTCQTDGTGGKGPLTIARGVCDTVTVAK